MTVGQLDAIEDAGRRHRLTPLRVAILVAILSRANIVIRRLARELGLSRQGVYNALARLTALHLVEISRPAFDVCYARPGRELRQAEAFGEAWAPRPPDRTVRPRPSKRPYRSERLIEALRRQGTPVFRAKDVRDLARSLGYKDSVGHLLASLVANGTLVRLKFGAYCFGHRIWGNAFPHPFAIASALVRGSVVGGLSALHHHGALVKPPAAVWLVVSRPLTRRPSAPGLDLEVLRVAPRLVFGDAEVPIDAFTRVRVLSAERALLDLLARPGRFGGVAAVVRVLAQALPRLDVAALMRLALRYRGSMMARRLGWTLEACGVGPDVTAPLLPLRGTGVERLDPALSAQGARSKRWRVIENAGGPREADS